MLPLGSGGGVRVMVLASPSSQKSLRILFINSGLGSGGGSHLGSCEASIEAVRGGAGWRG